MRRATRGVLKRLSGYLFGLFLIAAGTCAGGELQHGRCIGVSDGDTVTLLLAGQQECKVRLWGIDAPEKRQDCGQMAQKVLSTLIYGQVVNVKLRGKDRNGRCIGKIFARGEYINLRMVQKGMAWHFHRYAPEDHELQEAETAARSARAGLWRDTAPIPPWQWRQGKRGVSSTSMVSGQQKTRATTAPAATPSVPTRPFWVSGTGKIHSPACRYYGKGQKGHFSAAPTGRNCKICGGTTHTTKK